MTAWYRAGTIAVENGSTTVTGTLTAWASRVKPGDALVPLDGNGRLYEIAAVADNTNMTLAEDYGGATTSDLAYVVMPTSPEWGEVSTLTAMIAALVQQQTDILSGQEAPSDAIGGENSVYFQIEGSDALFVHFKTSGAWVGFPLTGPPGPRGPSYAGSSLSTVAIGTGTKTYEVQAGLAYSPGARVRFTDSGNVDRWVEGAVSSYAGTTMVVSVDKFNGSGTASSWNLNVAGEPGIGFPGPSYAATSATSLEIGTGSKAFTTQAGLAYVVGSRARAASAANAANFMEGVVTGYSGTTLTINVDLVGGSGTFADWNLSLAGQRGQTGATGAGYGGTSTTNRGLGLGSMSWNTQTNLAYQSGDLVKLTPTADPTKAMFGQVTNYASGVLTVNITRFIGTTGTQYNSWTIGLVGERGEIGESGAQAYKTTSTTSLTVGTGLRTAQVDANLAYLPGARVRLSAVGNVGTFMEGLVTAYSGVNMTVSVDRTSGSGTFASWNVNLAGQPGVDGSGAGTVNNALGGIELVSGGSTVQLTNTGVEAGSYGSATGIPAITVDEKGRITAAETVSFPDPVAMAIIFGA